ncbi:hypothetical protein MUY14_06470 [Amycolatopsis sp. FBCC-B4732]|uniref:hypothetical protein n=1 Tax=Amycolatopsis sp. FBCC-B4732 TaxID=3079339 RepID=UPI001FF180AC|nr:hypothetical protein [Amycolatopsis sp. FBCC-B4732]UOX90266.1 hypothetical protein MUY14_06470 [Amycolatopsis sp. FBCC-B4732]
MNRRGVLMAAAWLLAAAATAGVGTVALDVVGAGILGPQNQPLSAGDVARALETLPASSTSAPVPPATTTAPGAPEPRGLTVPGGSLVAKCTGDRVELLSWSPAPGFRADDVDRGPAATASVKFKDDGTENVVLVSCRDGEPHAETVADDGHHGHG